MGKAYKDKFLTHFGLPLTTELALTDIAALCGQQFDTLLLIFQQAKVYEYTPATTFSFHKKSRETKTPTDKAALFKVYEHIMKNIVTKKNAADISGTVFESV
jgi:hypothetical protein